jgi:hypothetical protein
MSIQTERESMMRPFTVVLALVVVAGSSMGQEKKGDGQKLKDLPAVVQKTVQDNLKGAEIKNIGKEKEDGIEQYEIESVLKGKSRDFNVDAKGKLLVMEVETTIDAIPAAAKTAILKRVADGKLDVVETYTKTGQPQCMKLSSQTRRARSTRCW